MPIYEYKCVKCGHGQDHKMPVNATKPSCPKCQESEQYVKQITAPQFHLKGSGWYQTDFKNKR